MGESTRDAAARVNAAIDHLKHGLHGDTDLLTAARHAMVVLRSLIERMEGE